MKILSCLLITFMLVACVSMINAHHGSTVESNNHQACVECHESNGCAEGSHPINITYPTDNNKSFHNAAYIINKGLVLADGKITCLSCHNLTKDQDSHLAITNIGSQLCMTCHRM